MPFEANGRQLRISDGDATRVWAAIEFRPDAESGPTVRRTNQAHDGGQVDERRAAPVHGDVREQPMLDLVPLARAWREMTHRDGETRTIRELLQCPLPEAQAGPLLPPASAVISSDWAWRYTGRPMCCHQR